MKHKQKAVTLIEVMVASVILVISIAALLGAYLPNYKISRDNRMKTQAHALIVSELEKIQTIKTNSDLETFLYHGGNTANPIFQNNPITVTVDEQDYNIYYTDFGGFPYTVHTVAEPGGSYIKDGGSAELIKVEVNVDWVHSGRNYSQSIITINQLAPFTGSP